MFWNKKEEAFKVEALISLFEFFSEGLIYKSDRTFTNFDGNVTLKKDYTSFNRSIRFYYTLKINNKTVCLPKSLLERLYKKVEDEYYKQKEFKKYLKLFKEEK